MAKDMKKRCLKCGAAQLFALVTIVKAVPLADRNGTIKVAGLKLGQMDAKHAWDKIGGENGIDNLIRGPIVCEACEAQHFFVVGDTKNGLRLGNVEEARELGHEELMRKTG